MESLSYPHLLRSLTLKYFLLNLFLFPFSALLLLMLIPAAIFLFHLLLSSFLLLPICLTYTRTSYHSHIILITGPRFNRNHPAWTWMCLHCHKVCVLCIAISTDGPLSCSDIMDRWKHPNFPGTTAILPPTHPAHLKIYIYQKKFKMVSFSTRWPPSISLLQECFPSIVFVFPPCTTMLMKILP